MTLKPETTVTVSHWTLYPRKNKGFSLMEVLCALVILASVILAAFASLDYTLKITISSRNRMEAFAAAERTAVASLASGKSVSDPQVDSSSTPINITLSINGKNRPVKIEAFTYREKNSKRLDWLMKRPVFVIFMKKT
ncbi:MAG: prepilin-type N-terminal cleavage/methylation domain-containing protein [Synergistaceae bacterium]|jgi:prepilin-type N-terminal cleavage/methylation domain-containing protein|nr:prepilin-type N-terminal cleavage/methylation domain-containing protein [Synergistaceae bacterium]